MSEPDEVLLQITETLDRLGLRYAVGGSVAASIHGIARSTRDLDLLVELPPSAVPTLIDALRADFYVPMQSMQDAIEHKSSFNVIHLGHQFKVDLFVAGNRAIDREELERSVAVVPIPDTDHVVRVAAPEVMVVRKLDWFRRGGGSSDRQWFDVLGILKVQAGRLDEAFMRRAAAELGVTDLLDRALRLQGPPPP